MKSKMLAASIGVLILFLLSYAQAQNMRPHAPKLVQLIVYQNELLGLDENGQVSRIDYRAESKGLIQLDYETGLVNCNRLSTDSISLGGVRLTQDDLMVIKMHCGLKVGP